MKQYRETRDIEPLAHGGGAKLKVNPEQLEILAKIIEDNNDATEEELCQIFEAETNLTVSRATMGRMSQKLKHDCKKKTLYAADSETERVQKLRSEYWQTVQNVQEEDFVFIDEAGVNLALVRLYARALKGKRALLNSTDEARKKRLDDWCCCT